MAAIVQTKTVSEKGYRSPTKPYEAENFVMTAECAIAEELAPEIIG